MKNTLILICLLFLTASVSGQLSDCPGAGFGGSTKAITTAISPAITFSDTIGEAPFSIHVSSEGTTAAGISYAYDHLEFTWDFGASGTNYIFTHPVTNALLNANTDQRGPEASFIYETPGTYLITLTARGWDGSGYITSSIQQTITVMPSTNGIRYIDPTGGNDSNTGMDSASAWQSWSQLYSWLSSGNNRTALIKRGEVLPATTSMVLSTSGITIGAYGSGSKPLIQPIVSLGGGSIIDLNTSGSGITNHHYKDVAFSSNKGLASGAVVGYVPASGPQMQNITFMNCDFMTDSLSGGLVVFTGGGPKANILSWNCTHEANDVFGLNYYAQDVVNFSVVGGYFSGGTGGGTLEHYIYPNNTDHALFRWVDFRQSNGGKNFCINMNTVTDGTTTDHVLIDGCEITGTNNGIDWGNTASDNSGHFNHAIVQNCAVHDLGEGQGVGMFGSNMINMTLRDNRFYGNKLEDLRMTDTDMILNLYRNKFHKASGLGNDQLQLGTGQTGIICENTFVRESTWGSAIAGGVTGTSSWTIDKNQYWTPSIPSPFYDTNAMSSHNLTSWQALGYDLSSTVSNPLWPDPANGDFGSLPLADYTFTTSGMQANFTNTTSGSPAGWSIQYQWDYNDGSPIDTFPNPSHIYSATGTYNSVLYATNTCGTDSITYPIVIDTLLSSGSPNSPKLITRIYPNPASDYVMISLRDHRIREQAIIEVFSVTGKKVTVQPQRSAPGTYRLDISGLPGGTYILSVKHGNSNSSSKFIKL